MSITEHYSSPRETVLGSRSFSDRVSAYPMMIFSRRHWHQKESYPASSRHRQQRECIDPVTYILPQKHSMRVSYMGRSFMIPLLSSESRCIHIHLYHLRHFYREKYLDLSAQEKSRSCHYSVVRVSHPRIHHRDSYLSPRRPYVKMSLPDTDRSIA